MTCVFDAETVSISCSNCDHKALETIPWLTTDRKIACACGANVCLDRGNFWGATKTDRGVGDFQRAVCSVGNLSEPIDAAHWPLTPSLILAVALGMVGWLGIYEVLESMFRLFG